MRKNIAMILLLAGVIISYFGCSSKDIHKKVSIEQRMDLKEIHISSAAPDTALPERLPELESSKMPEECSIKQIAEQMSQEYIDTTQLSPNGAAAFIGRGIRELKRGSMILLSSAKNYGEERTSITYIICDSTSVILLINKQNRGRDENVDMVGYYTTSEEGNWYYTENPFEVTDASLLSMVKLDTEMLTYIAPEIIFNGLLSSRINAVRQQGLSYLVQAQNDTGVNYIISIGKEDGAIEGIEYTIGNHMSGIESGVYTFYSREAPEYYNLVVDAFSRIQSSETFLSKSLIDKMSDFLE